MQRGDAEAGCFMGRWDASKRDWMLNKEVGCFTERWHPERQGILQKDM